MKESSAALPFIAVGCLLYYCLSTFFLFAFAESMRNLSPVVLYPLEFSPYIAGFAGFILSMIALARRLPRAVITVYAYMGVTIFMSIVHYIRPLLSMMLLCACLMMYIATLNKRPTPLGGVTCGAAGLSLSASCIRWIAKAAALKRYYNEDPAGLSYVEDFGVKLSDRESYQYTQIYAVMVAFVAVGCGIAGIVNAVRLKEAGKTKAFAAVLAVSIAAILSAVALLAARYILLGGRLR